MLPNSPSCKSKPGAKNDRCIKCLPTSAFAEYVLVSTPTPWSTPFIPLNHLLGPSAWIAFEVTKPSKPLMWFFLFIPVSKGGLSNQSLLTFCKGPTQPSTRKLL